MIKQFFAFSRGLSAFGGSVESTSTPAAAIRPSFKASAKSCSFTSGPLPVLMRINSVMLWWQMLPKSQGLKGTKVYFSLVCHSLLVLALFTLGSRLMELTLSGILLISEQRKREQGELGSG